MATKTLGTNGQTTLTAVQWSPDPASLSAVVKATLPIWPGAFTREGYVYIPERGILRLHPGDWVGVDATGWPIVVSNLAIAGMIGTATSWTHT